MQPVVDPISKRLLGNGANNGHGALALCYHGIAANRHEIDSPYTVLSSALAAQMQLLHDLGFRAQSADDIDQNKASNRTIILTFDDGYYDNYALALPILERFGYTATFFVVAAAVSNRTPQPQLCLRGKLTMTDQQLRDLRDRGMTVGAHGCAHRRLTSLSDHELSTELGGSKAKLEGIVEQAVELFAYPFGDHDDRVVEATRGAGFDKAFTTAPHWLKRSPDRLRLGRVTIMANDSLSRFARKLAFGDTRVGWPVVARYAIKKTLGKLK